MESGHQVLDQGGPVRPGINSQRGDRHLVTTFLALLSKSFVQPPNRRVKPEDRLHHDLEKVHQCVPSQDMGQFVREHYLAFLRFALPGEARRQVDAALP
jgi:hypothetical protein